MFRSCQPHVLTPPVTLPGQKFVNAYVATVVRLDMFPMFISLSRNALRAARPHAPENSRHLLPQAHFASHLVQQARTTRCLERAARSDRPWAGAWGRRQGFDVLSATQNSRSEKASRHARPVSHKLWPSYRRSAVEVTILAAAATTQVRVTDNSGDALQPPR
eukprot:1016906-Pyramimonas_sp.AAC.1